ncbi:hypothetical protein AN958_10571 [Leucoagaricus sp. SymC.cos]|nr:hypothetical protein AN958_10571 [Leucoagaricus sp. SymC.cos]
MFDLLKSPRPRGRDLPPEPRPDAHIRRPRPFSIRVRERWSKYFDHEPAPDPELDRLQTEVEQLRETERALKDRFEELEAEIETIEKKLSQRESQREELKQITKELAVAQRFLSTADSLSQAEVVRAMETLNEEIFQLTSILADRIQVEKKKLQPSERLEMFRSRIPSLGLAFLEVVEAKDLEDNLAIQIGWQATLAYWCSEVIGAWVVADLGREEVNGEMKEIYKGIKAKNDQAVAGRWRAIAHGVSEEISSEVRENLPLDAIRALVALPVLCGYISDRKSHDELCNAFQQRMGPLIDKCLKFRKMVGEGITSTDIRPYFLRSGEEYLSKYAELEYEDDKDGSPKEKKDVIACSLGLGLYCTRTTPGANNQFVEHREPILKPKVVLKETLKEIIA